MPSCSFTEFIHSTASGEWEDGSRVTPRRYPHGTDDFPSAAPVTVVDRCAQHGIWQEKDSDAMYYALGHGFDAKRLFTVIRTNWY